MKAAAQQFVNNKKNHFVFKTDPKVVYRRFLIMGGIGEDSKSLLGMENMKTYYASNPKEALRELVEVSTNGLNLKQEPVLFALMYIYKNGDNEIRQLVEQNFNQVVRTASHLFMTAEYAKILKVGWGNRTKRMFANWYMTKDPYSVAYQGTKYRNRNGWSHRDLMRKAHPIADNKAMNGVFKWLVTGDSSETDAQLIHDYETALKATTASDVTKIVESNKNITWEMVPNQFLTDSGVLNALAKNMPYGATVRYLNRFLGAGLFSDKTFRRMIEDRLTEKENIRKSKIHPMNLFMAWKMVQKENHKDSGYVSGMLETALENSFHVQEKTGKKLCLALDTSGSMTSVGYYDYDGSKNFFKTTLISPLEAEMIMAKYFVMAEGVENVDVYAFTNDLTKVDTNMFTKNLNEIYKWLSTRSYSNTNGSLVLNEAKAKKAHYDAFVMYTDNDINCGTPIDVSLGDYKSSVNPEAKWVTHAFSLNDSSVLPTSPEFLELTGMDPSAISATQLFIADKL